MTSRELLYNIFHFQFPTSQPLWTPNEGLWGMVSDKGSVAQLPTTVTTDVQGFIPSETSQQNRERLFKSMTVNQNIVDLKGNILVSNIPFQVDAIARAIIANRAIYQSVSGVFPNPIKWFHIGLIHKMEGNLNFNTYLGNGQVLSKVTTKVPKGRGPFPSFKAGAVDAIKLDKLNLVQDWSIGNTLYILEGFNGYGYSKYKGINSPYLFSGSNQYVSGYYPDDSVYSKTTVSQQIGIALIYKRMIDLGAIPL